MMTHILIIFWLCIFPNCIDYHQFECTLTNWNYGRIGHSLNNTIAFVFAQHVFWAIGLGMQTYNDIVVFSKECLIESIVLCITYNFYIFKPCDQLNIYWALAQKMLFYRRYMDHFALRYDKIFCFDADMSIFSIEL